MKFNKQGLYLLIFFLVFSIGGMSRFLNYQYYSNSDAFSFTIKWLVIPFSIIGLYYGYYSVYKIGPQQAAWRKVIGFICLSVLATLVFLKSAEGFFLEINSSAKNSRQYIVEGQISRINAPKNNRIFSTYTIEIITPSGEKLSFETKNNSLVQGEYFRLPMKKGSLGFIYLHN